MCCRCEILLFNRAIDAAKVGIPYSGSINRIACDVEGGAICAACESEIKKAAQV